jgi:hypothetical protein
MVRACIGDSRRLWGVGAIAVMGGQRRHRWQMGDSVSRRLSSSTGDGDCEKSHSVGWCSSPETHATPSPQTIGRGTICWCVAD